MIMYVVCIHLGKGFLVLLFFEWYKENPYQRGKIIKSLSEIFRADDPVFIAMGRDEITPQIITHAVEGELIWHWRRFW